MLIGIDARFYGSIGKGLGRYTQKLVEYLEKVDEKNQYIVFLRKENFEEYQPKNKNFRKELADYRWYSFAEQIFFPFKLRKYKFDLVHFPHFNVPLLYRKKFVLTIHDLILIHFPTVRATTLSPIFYWMKFFAYKCVIKSAIKRSQKIFAVSKFTKKDILETYKKIPEEKICVTYEACEKNSALENKNADNVLKKYGIMKPYIIYIGNVYPHKNPKRLVLAFKKLREKRKDISLVFVGGEDYFYSRLRDYVRENEVENIVFAGFVPDNDLDFLMSGSEAYIRPSLYEGFELPPLEAMSKGIPVLSSNHSCALEILGGSALYFDGKNVDDIADSVWKILTDEKLRENLIQKGYDQIKKYSWEGMAKKTLEVYNSLKKDAKK
ncbi:MAG TPA: glycosyltransferase family 1 protein [Candidatus Moranbacteria bacterium]|jgi:glycosyltransferase involved in cell wall biosynthesis|nr:glycosyltransferase family 4 protein [Candidatus Moranbacteria bacterium]HPX94117.1 glycosyltransferase family 1 protein [Candidatus Moranbacteria bacterium]HQB59177.1 glycosyltransferase family 1 protein [Candidatus Moranbacteria bacterium]